MSRAATRSRSALAGVAAGLALGGALSGCARPVAVVPSDGPGPVALRGEARGLFTADPDGDGTRSLYVLFGGELAEARLEAGTWTLARRYAEPGVQWVNGSAGDLDGDGRDEVALTGLRPQVASVVLSGGASGTLVPRARHVPLYLRIARLPGLGVGLACQRPSSEEPYLPPPMRCALGERGVERGDPLALPPGLPLDDFVVVPQGGGEALYTFGDDGRWTRRHGRDPLWRSDGRWQARPLAIERTFASLLGEVVPRFQAFSTWPLVDDLDGDGAAEVWQPTSDDGGFTVLSRVRIWKGGSWLRLEPRDYGLEVRASGPLVGQAMVGLAAFDLTADGRPEVVGAAWLRPRGSPLGARSTLMAWDVATSRPVGPGAPPSPIPAPPPEAARAPLPAPAPEPAPDAPTTVPHP